MFTLAQMERTNKKKGGGEDGIGWNPSWNPRGKKKEKNCDRRTNLTKEPPTHSALRFLLELRHLEFWCGAAQDIGFEGGIQHWKEGDWAPQTALSMKLTP